MGDINIGAISEALNNKVDLPSLTTPQDAVDYVVEKQDPTSANGYTWYRKYKSGWVEQGGKLSGLSVVFPCAFSQIPTVCTSTKDSSTAVVSSVTIYSETTTGFSGRLTQGNKDWDSGVQNMNGYWTAVGIAE